MLHVTDLDRTVSPALQAAGYRTEIVTTPFGPLLAGRRRDFRVRWFCTQLKTTVTVTAVGQATGELVRQFAAASFNVAKTVTGGLPNGLQSGVGCVAVLIADTVDADAVAVARSRPTREWFQGVSTLALLDASTGAVHTYEGRVVVGRVYTGFLRDQRHLAVQAAEQALRS